MLVGFGRITLRGQNDPPGAKLPSLFGADGWVMPDGWLGGKGKNEAGVGIGKEELLREGENQAGERKNQTGGREKDEVGVR